MLKKLTSRKLIACVVGVVIGLVELFGLDESVITTVAGAVTAVGSVVTYIITEGCVDAAAVSLAQTAAEQVTEAVEAVTTDTADTDADAEAE